MSSRLFRTALVAVPLPKPHLIRLRQVFPTLLYRPSQGPDISSSSSPPHASAADWAEADAVLAWSVPAELKHFATQTPRLRLWQLYKAGHSDVVDSEYVRSIPKGSEVVFSNMSGCAAPNIGEHILGVVLALTHKIHTSVRIAHAEQRWMAYDDPLIESFFIRELRTLKVGIIGYGHIGRETARLFHAHGSPIYALTRSGRPTPESGYFLPTYGDPSGALPSQWFSSASSSETDDFLAQCDVVVNTLPASSATEGFVGEKVLRAMKGDAIYVNVGRGSTTDHGKLVEALRATPGEGERRDAVGTLRIGAAALDVTAPEPLPPSSPLWTLPNCLITPHISGATASYYDRAVELMLENVRRIEAGEGAWNAFRGRGARE
ncbi:hypothetical protein JCM8097_000552 [Rhodosporidiobolus ruineniae]